MTGVRTVHEEEFKYLYECRAYMEMIMGELTAKSPKEAFEEVKKGKEATQ